MNIQPPFFPARPVNGGPLPKALPKTGDWSIEGKYNGWRAWVHNPTGLMFNRQLAPLSINGEFAPALAKLRAMPWEWSDVEALERRHHIGRGTLILLDYLSADPAEIYTARKLHIQNACTVAGGIEVHKRLNEPLANDRVYLPMYWRMAAGTARVGDFVESERNTHCGDWLGLWDILQQCNLSLGAVPFWEGLVAKRNDSIYPRQRRSAELDFPFWMKHRWAF